MNFEYLRNRKGLKILNEEGKNLLNFEHHRKLLDWIDESKLYLPFVTHNPNGVFMIEKNLDKINNKGLCQNPNIIHILEENPHLIDLGYLTKNKNAIHLLKNNLNNLNLLKLCNNSNPEAIKIIENNVKILSNGEWYDLCNNISAIDLLEANLDKINWYSLAFNKNGIRLFESYPDKLEWIWYPQNDNDSEHLEILTENNHSSVWKILSLNENAIHLL